ncbi:hypothetical protein, partial [Actinacidiphila rubida]|uniref:hypothetical protein n=1 Tax=Actinacidiphila rubida TaxID=310780 RepID=UPI00159F2078
FADAWQARPEEFDALATAMLQTTTDPNLPSPDPEQVRAAANAFAREVNATGQALITPDGFPLDPQRSATVARLVPHLQNGDTPEAVRQALADAGAPLPEEIVDRYRDLLAAEGPRQAALRRPHLAEHLLFAPDVLDLLRTRPSMLDLVERTPDVLRHLLRVTGLPGLLAHDDLAYSIFSLDAMQRENFTDSQVAVIRANPHYMAAFKQASYELIQDAHQPINRLAMQSPALSQAIAADPDVLQTFVRSPGLAHALGTAGEPVIRAVTAAPGRLEGAAEDPASVAVLAAVPRLADVLAATSVRAAS